MMFVSVLESERNTEESPITIYKCEAHSLELCNTWSYSAALLMVIKISLHAEQSVTALLTYQY